MFVKPTIDRPTEAAGLAAMDAAPRAMVLLTVEWSIFERASRASFVAAAVRLSRDHAGLGVRFFMLDEDAPACPDAIRRIADPRFGAGAGTVVWVERGRRVAIEVNPGRAAGPRLAARALAMWGRPNE